MRGRGHRLATSQPHESTGDRTAPGVARRHEGGSEMSIRARLLLLIGGAALLVALTTIAGLLGIRATERGLKSVYEDRVVPLRLLKAVSDLYAVDLVDNAHKVRDGATSWDEGVARIRSAREAIARRWAEYADTSMTDEEKRLAAQAKARMADADRAVERMLQIMQSRDGGALREFAAARLYPAIDPVTDAINGLAELQLKVAQHEYEAAETRYRTLLTALPLAVAAVLVLGALFAVASYRSISRSIDEAVRVADAVGAGDLDVVAASGGNDEMTRLRNALAVMVQKLRGVMTAVRTSADSVATASGEI
ncbi:MAG: Tar ligand binding domain-containing protein, partial [Burkholderiaceae bacterium]